ncbi:UDP-glycosyltransferase 79B6 [Beta vulgaris subsp. vulgaris]|uniref:UDP-glycosyltransferase 79B6 n=1 Tax=Beta vulgaris subsp. vulgaris TaxID=3555 RepID=UPI0020370E1F|nr:UDP-glycosyltransferase 79B6 [Beta vulgaris subsp. vulgaris]
MGKQLHIVMFPWFAIGHMTPFLHLSNKLAEYGHKITFLLPKKAKHQLQHLLLYPSLITLHPITIPHVHPLPPGTETASEIPLHLNNHLATALDLTRLEVEYFIITLQPKPHLLFYDIAFWVPEIASKLQIKSICYNVVCAASLAIALVPSLNVGRDQPVTEEDVAKPPPGYPSSNVVFHGPEARSLLFIGLEFGSGLTFYDRIVTAMKSCDAIAIRTCREIEDNFCDYISAQYNKPVLLTGPVLPETNNNHPLEAQWVEWLSRFEPNSVVFCAFGSQFILEKDQFQELLLGFEMTMLPFLVALKPPQGCGFVEEALPEGFKERVGERGVVHGGWVQQPLILAHPSVGCFVNHCGFGSMWESLMAESQIVMVPQLGDQILNTRLMSGELVVGVEVERAENGWVSKESLCKAIKSVMGEDSEVGCLVRNNHAKWRQIIVSQGFMRGYIDNFVKDLELLMG